MEMRNNRLETENRGKWETLTSTRQLEIKFSLYAIGEIKKRKTLKHFWKFTTEKRWINSYRLITGWSRSRRTCWVDIVGWIAEDRGYENTPIKNSQITIGRWCQKTYRWSSQNIMSCGSRLECPCIRIHGLYIKFMNPYMRDLECEPKKNRLNYSWYLQSTATPFVLKSFFASVISYTKKNGG